MSDEQEQPEQQPEPLLVSVPEAARRIGIDVRYVRRLIKADAFPHKVIYGRVYVPVQRMIEWANTTNGV